MAFSSVLQMYLGWANSIMCERGVLIEGLEELRDGVLFCHLIELLTETDLGIAKQTDNASGDQVSLNSTVQVALDYLDGIGVKVRATAASVVCGELKSILDMLWSIILHCTIHSPDRSTNQRTVRNGRKTLLQWCRDELRNRAVFDINTTMVKSFNGNNLLSDLISVHCSFVNDEADNDDELVTNLTNAVLAAEDHLGISKSLLNPADVITGIADEHALLIYVALLRRKVTILMSRTSSLSSLSSNDSFAFNIPTNSRHEITEALQKAHSFRFIRSSRRRKNDLRKFVLDLTRQRLTHLQNGLVKARKSSTSSVPDSITSSASLPTSQASEATIPAQTNHDFDDQISSASSHSQNPQKNNYAPTNNSHKHEGKVSTSFMNPEKREDIKSTPLSKKTANFHQSEESISATSKDFHKHEGINSSSSNNFYEEESGVDSSEIQSVSHMVSSWNRRMSVSPLTTPNEMQSSYNTDTHFQNLSDSNQMTNEQHGWSQQIQRSQPNQRSQQGQQRISNEFSQVHRSGINQSEDMYSYQQNSYHQGEINDRVQSEKSYGVGDPYRGQRSDGVHGGGDTFRDQRSDFINRGGNVHRSDVIYGADAQRGQRSDVIHGGGDIYQGQRSDVNHGRGDAHRGQRLDVVHKQHDVDNARQQNGNVDVPQFERQRRTSGQGILPKEDELLNILEAISLESSHLRQELNESQQRETSLKEELNKSTSAAEEHVVSKLVQELEMLRAENRRLFQDSAHARKSNAHDKRTSDKLQATINRLKNDVDQLNSDNFRLKLRLKLLESHKIRDGGEDGGGEDAERRDQEFLMDQFMDLPKGASSEELIQHLSSNQQLLGNFSDVNVQLANKLSELNDELTSVKVGSRRLEQENRLLKMSAETSKMEVEVVGSKCRRLEDHLSLSQKKNAKLVQDLHGIAKETSPEADKTCTFLRMRQLEEENTLLKQRLELADEDRQLLKRKLEQYTKHQAVIDAMFKSDMKASVDEEDEIHDKQSIARERVMQSVKGRNERNQPVTNGFYDHLDLNKNESKFDGNVYQNENGSAGLGRRINNVEEVKQRKPGHLTSVKSRNRKPSLGHLIVEKATSPRDETEYQMQEEQSGSDMYEADENTPPSVKYEIEAVGVESLSQQEVTTDDDDINSQTTEEMIGLGQPQEFYYPRNTDQKQKHSKFTSISSSMTKLRGITDRSKMDLSANDSGKKEYPENGSIKQDRHDVLQSSVNIETSNPRLEKLQRLRKSLGIDRPGQELSGNFSAPQQRYQKEEADFEIKSRIGVSEKRRIAKWNKFNSYKEDDDLGSSYLEPSNNNKCSMQSTTESHVDIVKKQTKPGKSYISESDKAVEDSRPSRPQFGRVSLDDYVQSLKHRVKALEIETEEFDEYIRLPEHFTEPQRLAERSPKRDSAKGSPEDRPLAKPISGKDRVKSSQTVSTKEGKRSDILRTRRSPEQKESSVSMTPFSSRASGDGMSDCHGQQGDATTDDDQPMNLDEITESEDDTKTLSQSDQSISNPTLPQEDLSKNPSNKSGAKKTQSPPQTKSLSPDQMVQKILSESMASSGDTEKLLHLSSEESKSYKHRLLKAEEQEYANSIIEKYLEQLSVTPQ